MLLKKRVLLAILAFVLLGLVACRGAVETHDPETRLQERIDGYIQARQNADLIALQSFYLNPGKARIGNIKYLSSEISEISLSKEGKKAQVKLKNSMQVMGFTFKETPQNINFTWERGDWYLLLDNKPSTPFADATNNSKKNPQDANVEKK